MEMSKIVSSWTKGIKGLNDTKTVVSERKKNVRILKGLVC